MTAAQTPEGNTPDLKKPDLQAPAPQAKKTPPARRALGLTVGLLVALGAGGIVWWYAYNGSQHVSTDNARVAANTANIVPEIPGRVLQWNVAVGTTVTAGQVIGQIDTSTVAQSSAANAGALSQTAPLTASRSLIRAPISGQVIQSSALVGQLVATGQSLAVIADDSSAYISANVKEDQISKVKLGQPVHVTLDALPGQTLSGRVQQIGQATASTFSLLPSGGADNGNFTKVAQVIPVSIYLSTADRSKLLPGSSASVTIDLTDPPSTPTSVKTATAAPEPLKVQLNVVGTLTSGNDVTIAAQVAGNVTKVGAQVGDNVTKGEVLARIDDSNLQAQLAGAQAALSQVQNGGNSAQANLQLAASTLDRVSAVYKLGGVSRQDLQNAQTQYTNAQVAAQNAGGGAVEAAQANVQNLKLMIGKAVVVSPIDGVVSARNVEVGEVAAPGVPLMTIVQNDPRKIVATIPAAQANLIKAGQPMQIKFDAFPNRSYSAKITSINPASVATGDFYPIEARLDAANAELRAGMVATGTINADVSAGSPTVPSSAIARIGAQNYVYVVKDGKAVRTPIQTGLSGTAGGQAEVAVNGGLPSGAQIVTSNVNALWDGAPVKGN
ncbi:efflux RND transporter periplasmic adaptor subunit (plasmid) [Deinococcus psychrotolerans]|uniref:Efflux RND transporter periplasmic adaptor subunit n=1 Tax=Deinococcus psychrotolerans TaxID=2489213 RepID=A0A3G8YIS6_9DEIO|nr:efflux RND transporter periplasmic adaptor subunit [Deinococcus psychrotolerans]AZI44660.1 efflux RND transporter periplasmic adaptor subunit [Deinococcus psychrotolerans]